MPHTNRKKKPGASNAKAPKIIHTKRQLLDDDEGWTHVVDAKKTTKPIEVKELGHKPWEGDVISGTTAIVTMNSTEMQAEHVRFKQQWEGSEACSKLKTMLADMKVEIDKVVCLGLGTLQDWKLQARRASHTQLAALQTIMQCLKCQDAVKIAQEPNATELDVQFMNAMGFKSVGDPEGYKEIDEKTLVFGVHLYPAQYRDVGRAGKPALLVGNDVKAWTEKARYVCHCKRQ